MNDRPQDPTRVGKARNWRDVRAEAVASGHVDPARADAARRQMKRSGDNHSSLIGDELLDEFLEGELDFVEPSPEVRDRFHVDEAVLE